MYPGMRLGVRVPDSEVWTNRDDVHDDQIGKTVRVARNRRTGWLCCSCRRFIVRQECDHIGFVESFQLPLNTK